MSRAARRVVLGVLLLAFVIGAVYLWQTGSITPTSVRDWLDSLGPKGPALFVVAFVAGSFVGLPGMAFVIGGRLAFGPYLGLVLGYGGGLLAVTIPFVLARRFRANSTPFQPKNKHAARAFGMLETHPFRGVLVLRLILWFNPPLSYALALTIPFVLARRFRANSTPFQPKNKHAARAFGMLETHPFRGVLVLRLILWFNPPLSYALAFTTVTMRTYVAACALALLPVVSIAVVATSWLA